MHLESRFYYAPSGGGQAYYKLKMDDEAILWQDESWNQVRSLFSRKFLSWNADTCVSFLSFSYFSQIMVVHDCANLYIHYQLSNSYYHHPEFTAPSIWRADKSSNFTLCLRSGILTTRTSASVILPSSSLSVKIGHSDFGDFKTMGFVGNLHLTCHYCIIREAAKRCEKPWKTIECYWGLPTWCTSFSQDSYLLCYSTATDVVKNSSWCAFWIEVWNGCMGWSLSLSEDLWSRWSIRCNLQRIQFGWIAYGLLKVKWFPGGSHWTWRSYACCDLHWDGLSSIALVNQHLDQWIGVARQVKMNLCSDYTTALEACLEMRWWMLSRICLKQVPLCQG